MSDLAPPLARSLVLLRFDPDTLRELLREAEDLVALLSLYQHESGPESEAYDRACSLRAGIRLLVRAAERGAK